MLSDTSARWPETEWSLIGRAKQNEGDELSNSAWRDLVEAYRIPIEKVLRRYLVGAHSVDEAVASFFGYLFEGRVLDKPRSEDGRFRAYIQAVARNYARHWMSRENGHEVSGIQDGPAGTVEPDARAWLPTILDMALARMREKDAELLRRFYGLSGLEQTSGDELAQQLGTSRMAAYKRLHGARLRLREELRQVLRDLSADADAWALELEWIAEVLESRLASPPLE